MNGALAPEGNLRPRRESFEREGYSYFVLSQTAGRKPFFRHERWAKLLQEVFEHYRGEAYSLHAYVIMPDHFHALVTPLESLERTMQKIKSGYSFRAKKMFEWSQDVWQAGFSDHRIRDFDDWRAHVGYIRQNPVRSRLCSHAEEYPYLALDLDAMPQGLKPGV